MIDKQRHHRLQPAPHGFLPNWVLVVLATGAMALVGFAHSFI